MAKGMFATGMCRPGMFATGMAAGLGSGVSLAVPILRRTLTLRSSNRLTLTLTGPGAADLLGELLLLEDGTGLLLEGDGSLLLEGPPTGRRLSLTLKSSKRQTLTMRS